MKEWVDRNYPGRGISIGEWNFGGQQDITGALAAAEVLGRFAQFGVTSAFYWTAPPAGSTPMFAFLAYRNFDGHGGRFLDSYVPTTTVDKASFFASRDATGKHVVIVALNMDPDTPLAADVDLASCGTVASSRTYVYTRGSNEFAASASKEAAAVQPLLAPWSITVIDVQLGQSAGNQAKAAP
jgi:hypothetical protein